MIDVVTPLFVGLDARDNVGALMGTSLRYSAVIFRVAISWAVSRFLEMVRDVLKIESQSPCCRMELVV